MQPKILNFSSLAPFSLSLIHHPHIPPLSVNDSHIHDQCEIYINLSGNVSFMVEGRLYPVERGDCIITRPFEYHHCVYHKMKPHEHYWILFSCAGNEGLLSPFFDRPKGVGNRIIPANKERFLRLCAQLEMVDSPLDRYSTFFRLLQSLKEGSTPKETDLPEELQIILYQINENFRTPLRIQALAKKQFLSISTLERQFRAHLGVTPVEYLRQKRIAYAATLLQEDLPVSRVAAESGFSDTSQFIALFKKQFGKTPLQYKKSIKDTP